MILELDARTKIIIFLTTIFLAFTFKDLLSMLTLLAAVSLLILLKGKAIVRKSLKLVFPMVIVAFITWSLMHNLSIFYSQEAGVDLNLGAFMAIRLAVILLASLWFVFAVKPSELINALAFFGLPYKAVFIAGLSLRHVNTVADDYKAIKESLASRGLELDKGFIITRIKNYALLLTPLIVRSIENAERLVLAMELKGFSFNRRRRRVERPDYFNTTIICGALLLIVLAVLHYWMEVV